MSEEETTESSQESSNSDGNEQSQNQSESTPNQNDGGKSHQPSAPETTTESPKSDPSRILNKGWIGERRSDTDQIRKGGEIVPKPPSPSESNSSSSSESQKSDE